LAQLHETVLAPSGWKEYDLDVKSDQTTDDVHHVMSAEQNRQSFRILARIYRGIFKQFSKSFMI